MTAKEIKGTYGRHKMTIFTRISYLIETVILKQVLVTAV